MRTATTLLLFYGWPSSVTSEPLLTPHQRQLQQTTTDVTSCDEALDQIYVSDYERDQSPCSCDESTFTVTCDQYEYCEECLSDAFLKEPLCGIQRNTFVLGKSSEYCVTFGAVGATSDICLFYDENEDDDDSCQLTMNGAACTSCRFVTCADGTRDMELDCGNIVNEWGTDPICQGNPIPYNPVAGFSGGALSFEQCHADPTVQQTPAPVTAAPVTAAPVTATPMSAAPVSAAPVSSAPVSAAPVSAAPVSTAPTVAPVAAGTPPPVSNAPVIVSAASIPTSSNNTTVAPTRDVVNATLAPTTTDNNATAAPIPVLTNDALAPSLTPTTLSSNTTTTTPVDTPSMPPTSLPTNETTPAPSIPEPIETTRRVDSSATNMQMVVQCVAIFVCSTWALL